MLETLDEKLEKAEPDELVEIRCRGTGMPREFWEINTTGERKEL